MLALDLFYIIIITVLQYYRYWEVVDTMYRVSVTVSDLLCVCKWNKCAIHDIYLHSRRA
jgi:hypothetical protein